MNTKLNNKRLRKTMQQQRQALTPQQQAEQSQRICQLIHAAPVFQKAQHVAFYTPIKGEANPLALQQQSQHKTFYLPVLTFEKKQPLIFVKIEPKTRYKNNQYGIPEPYYDIDDIMPRDKLDLVIMPLVVCDTNGNRLGMGGGYYDRSFAFKKGIDSKQLSPLLIGFAYNFQVVENLSPEAWDVPLDYLATDQLLINIKA